MIEIHGEVGEVALLVGRLNHPRGHLGVLDARRDARQQSQSQVQDLELLLGVEEHQRHVGSLEGAPNDVQLHLQRYALVLRWGSDRVIQIC